MIDLSEHRTKASMLLQALERGIGRLLRQVVATMSDLPQATRAAVESRARGASTSNQIADDPVSELYLSELLELLSSLDAVDPSIRAATRRISEFFQTNDVAEVRNAIAHPVRAWKPHYLPIVEAMCLREDVTVILELREVAEAYAQAESGQLKLPTDDWLRRVQPPLIPNNLAEYARTSHTAVFVGRGDERKRLRKILVSPRTKTVSVVGPGGIGKTAFVLKVLQEIVADRSLLNRFDRVLFVTGKSSRLTYLGRVQQPADFNTVTELETAIANALDSATIAECLEAFSDLRLLLCIDNIEELAGSESDALEELQLSLPESWVLLLTSRIAVSAQNTILLSPLGIDDLTKLAIDRLASHGMAGPNALQAATALARAATSPLALVLSVDSMAVGGSDAGSSVRHAAALTTEFAFSTLLETLDPTARRVLDVVHVSAEAADLDATMELLNTRRHEIERAVSCLRRANLLLPAGPDSASPLRLTPQVLELLSRQAISDLSRDHLFRGWNQLQLEAKRLPALQDSGLPAAEDRATARVSLLRLVERTRRCVLLDRGERLELVDAIRDHERDFGESCNTAWLLADAYSHLPDCAAEVSAQAARSFSLAPGNWRPRLRIALLRFEVGDHAETVDLLRPLINSFETGRDDIPLREQQVAFSRYFQAQMFALSDRIAAGRPSSFSEWGSIIGELEHFKHKPLDLNRRLALAIALRRSIEREPCIEIRTASLSRATALVMAVFNEQGAVLPSWTSEVLALLRQFVLSTKLDPAPNLQLAQVTRELIDAWGLELTQRHADGLEMAYALKDASSASERWNVTNLDRGELPTRLSVGQTTPHSLVTSVYAPPMGREFCFTQDAEGKQYFVHRSATRGASFDFMSLKHGDRLAIVPATTHEAGRAIRAISAELISIQPQVG